MLALGGDVQRVIDGPFATIDRFTRYISRITAIAEGARPIVVLTRTIPLAMTVLNARRKIESALPAMEEATWAIFVDPAEDPFFEAAARKIGSLSDTFAKAPIWYGPSEENFLILSPQVDDPRLVRDREEELSVVGPPISGPITKRPTPRIEAPDWSGARAASSGIDAERAPSARSGSMRPLGSPWPFSDSRKKR